MFLAKNPDFASDVEERPLTGKDCLETHAHTHTRHTYRQYRHIIKIVYIYIHIMYNYKIIYIYIHHNRLVAMLS